MLFNPIQRHLTSPSSSSISSLHGSGTQTPVTTITHEEISSPDNSSTIQLSTILNETARGKGIVEYFNKFSSFHEDQRSILISLIAQYYEEKGVKMSLSDQLEREILERFPSEKLVTYNCIL